MSDHADHVMEVEHFPMVVSAMIKNIRMTKFLMYGRSSINILYKDAFEMLKINPSKLHASQSPFHGVVPRQRVMPLSTIIL